MQCQQQSAAHDEVSITEFYIRCIVSSVYEKKWNSIYCRVDSRKIENAFNKIYFHYWVEILQVDGVKSNSFPDPSTKSEFSVRNSNDMLLIQSSWVFFIFLSASLSYVWCRNFFFLRFRLLLFSRLLWKNWTARTIIDDFIFFPYSVILLKNICACMCLCCETFHEKEFFILQIFTFSLDDRRDNRNENSKLQHENNYFSYFLLVLIQANNMKSHWNIIVGNFYNVERDKVIIHQMNLTLSPLSSLTTLFSSLHWFLIVKS